MTDELSAVVSQEQLEAERTFIGSVVRSPDIALRDAGWLDVDTFMNPLHKQFWSRVKNGEDPLEVTLDIPELTMAFSWSNDVIAGRVGEYANALDKKNYLRGALSTAEDIAKGVMERDTEKIQALALQLGAVAVGGSNSMRSPMEIGSSLNQRIDRGNISIPWGIASIDQSTRGSERGTMTLLAGRPSMGKSSLAFQVSEFQAIDLGLRVGIWALEMSAEQMFARRNCYKIGKMWMDVRSGNITPQERENLKKHVYGYAELLDGHMWVDDSASTKVSDIIRVQLRERYDVLMIDHGGLLNDKKMNGERHDQLIDRQTKLLHALTKSTQSVTILLWQLNRGVEGRTNKRPAMSDLRDSGALEQNADNVGLLYGDWYYDKTAKPYTELNWGKFRDGIKDTLCLVEFDMTNQTFKSVQSSDWDTYVEQQMEIAYKDPNDPNDIPF